MTLPLDEAARQRALDAYRVVDSIPESAYDDIVQLASLICEVPVALVSLIDRDRQWFKARRGLELRETSRDVAFCDHAIRDPDLLLEVPDAQRDARFADNPLVTGDTAIRFYAGMPLVTPGGAAIGTVCVIDQKPRELTAAQREALGSLARLTMNLLEGRQREREFERAALLAKVDAAEEVVSNAPEAVAQHCTVAIIELQDYAGVVHARGERAVERAMARMEQEIDAHLQHARGDSVSRVSGGAEVIVVVHGDDAAAVLQSIQRQLDEFGTSTGLRVLMASGSSETPGEVAHHVFMRADIAMSQLKDDLAYRAAAA